MTDIITRTSDDEVENLTEKLDKIKCDSSQYAVMMETDSELYESWYYFIKCQDNMDNLMDLKKQIDSMDMFIYKEYNTFDIELDHLVSANTAKEMIRLELNSGTFHRKFDGILKPVNLGFSQNDKNKRKLVKINRVLKNGRISKFISDEDVPSCASSNEDDDDDTDEEMFDSEKEVEKNSSTRKPAVFNKDLPKFARHKHHKK